MLTFINLQRVGSLALTGLGCGLAAHFLKGRTIANWTWMPANMAFQRGIGIGGALAVINICYRMVQSYFTPIFDYKKPQNSSAKLTVTVYFPLVTYPIFYLWTGLPFLSCLTLGTISSAVHWFFSKAFKPKPPFFHPPGWGQIDEPDFLHGAFKIKLEHKEGSLVLAWVALTQERWSDSLAEYQNALLANCKYHGRTGKVLGNFTPADDPGFLLEVLAPSQQGVSRCHQLAIVKGGMAFTLNVGVAQTEKFNDYFELFNQVLCSWQLGNSSQSVSDAKLQEIRALRSLV